MADGILSQEEINALLGGAMDDTPGMSDDDIALTPEEIDALGEIGNINMGTAATTLFSLLNHKVMITTPKVTILTAEEMEAQITDDMVTVSIDYTIGLVGTNLLMLKESDVRIITDLMMGGTGVDNGEPLNELHLSAISEAMNQMIGSSSTSMSQMFEKKIDISPPQAVLFESAKEKVQQILGEESNIVKIAFRMQILENIIDSELMQILPVGFARELVNNLMDSMQATISATPMIEPVETPSITGGGAQLSQAEIDALTGPTPEQTGGMLSQAEIDALNQTPPVHNMEGANPAQGYGAPPMGYPPQQGYAAPPMGYPPQQGYAAPPMGYPPQYGAPPMGYPQPGYGQNIYQDIQVQTPQFQTFGQASIPPGAENIDILMDVSLEVSVELGRTKKKIREILDFAEGSIIELDKLVGEHIDILVNGKFVANGEVVVIDENFGVRIKSIIKPENRI